MIYKGFFKNPDKRTSNIVRSDLVANFLANALNQRKIYTKRKNVSENDSSGKKMKLTTQLQ